MATSDPLDILLAHDRWATKQILLACEKLTPVQFHQKFDIGPGSLHDTLLHMMGAMSTWTDTLAGRVTKKRLEEGGERSVKELLELVDTCCEAFESEVRRRPLNETVTRTLRATGKTFTFTRGNIATHVATHGMHHRAQCLNMLRHLGVKPLPPSSVTEWSWLA